VIDSLVKKFKPEWFKYEKGEKLNKMMFLGVLITVIGGIIVGLAVY
jgi:hypothetical protein